jgi:hypothetical protein
MVSLCIMAVSEGDGIEKVLGPFIALVSDTHPVDEYTLERRAFFEKKGISFPSEEVEQLLALWDAKAAKDRGSFSFTPEGTIIDPGDFSYSDATRILQHKKLDLDNKEKLNLFIRLEFIAKAGALAIETIVGQKGSKSPSIQPAENLLEIQKNYAQLMMATEGWDQPWQDTVANEFDGPSLTFPLPLENIEVTYPLFTAIPLFRQIQKSTSVGLFMMQVRNDIEHIILERFDNDKLMQERDDRHIGAAIVASLYYRHSPDASQEFIHKYITPTGGDLDWVVEIEQAVQRANENLYSKKNNN